MTASHRGLRATIYALITLAIFSLAIYALSQDLHKIALSQVLDSIGRLSWSALWIAAGCTAGSYSMLTLYDYLAVRAIGRRLPYPKVALTSFTAFGISHSAGISSISGGSIRLRCYMPLGVSTLEVAGIMTLVAINFFLGVGTILCFSLWLGADQAAAALPITADQSRMLSLLLLVVLLGYGALTLFRKRPFHIRGKVIQLPSLRLTLGQLVVSSCDLSFAAGALYILMPNHLGVSYPMFVGLFVLAMQAGVLSNVPGGLGVFETVLLLTLPQGHDNAILGAILLFRIYYYLAPLLLGLSLLAVREVLEQRHYLQRAGAAIRRWINGNS